MNKQLYRCVNNARNLIIMHYRFFTVTDEVGKYTAAAHLEGVLQASNRGGTGFGKNGRLWTCGVGARVSVLTFNQNFNLLS